MDLVQGGDLRHRLTTVKLPDRRGSSGSASPKGSSCASSPSGRRSSEIRRSSIKTSVILLPESHAQFYIAETLIALDYMHGKGVLHRDIKVGPNCGVCGTNPRDDGN